MQEKGYVQVNAPLGAQLNDPQKRHKDPYPEQADQKIRQVASKFSVISSDAQQVIQTLDMIKNELLGNSEAAQRLAQDWTDCNVMSDSSKELQDAMHNLAGRWQGAAFQQYSAYSSDVVATLNNNQSTMGNIATALAHCVALVFSTYSSAIKLILNCAADLASLELD